MSDFKTFVDGEATKEFDDYIKRELDGASIPLEVDYASFENASSKRVMDNARYWHGYYVFGRAGSVIAWLIRDQDAKEEIRNGLSKIVFRHNNNGKPRDERFSYDKSTKTLTLEAAYCCSWHSFDYYDLYYYLGRELDILEKGYIKKIQEKAIPDGMKRIQDGLEGTSIPIEVNFESFQQYNNDDKDERALKLKALRQAAEWTGWSSTQPISSAFYWLCREKKDITPTDVQNAISKVVIRNVRSTKQWKKKVWYDAPTKILYCDAVYQLDYYGRLYYSDIQQVLYQAVLTHKLGGSLFDKLTEEQHADAVRVLENAATSLAVSYGDFDYLKQVLESAFYHQCDNRTKKAFIILMKFINSKAWKESLAPDEEFQKDADDEDNDDDDKKKEGEDDKDKKKKAKPEVFIRGWPVTKINYKGMEQQRLVWVTNDSLYTAAWDWGSEKPNPKKIHRYRHAWYNYINMGELKSDSGAPSVPGAAAVAGAAAKLGVGGGGGGPYGFKMFTYRKTKDEKAGAPKKFKMPEIPNLKDGIVKMFKKLVDAVKSISFPEFSLPGLPSFELPNLFDLIGKTISKPKLPSVDLSASSGGTTHTQDSCAADLPPQPDGLKKFAETRQKVESSGKKPEGLKLPNMPDLGVASTLERIGDSIEKITNIDIELPKEFKLPSILKMFAKKLGPDAGFSIPKPGDLGVGALMEAIRDSLGDIGEDIKKGMNDFIEAAKDACPDIDFPEFPSLNLKKVIKAVMEPLGKVSIPTPDIDIKDFLPGLPALPGMPALPKVNLPGAPNLPAMPGFLKSPSEPYYLELTLNPRPDDGNLSKWVCKEIAWVTYGAARAYHRPYYISQPYEVDYGIRLESALTARLYNGMHKGEWSKPKEDISGTDFEEFEKKHGALDADEEETAEKK